MFSGMVETYSDNLEALRDFVGLLSPVLSKAHEDEIKSDPISFLPAILAMDAINQSLSDERKKSLLERFDGDIELDVRTDSDSKSVSVKVRGKGNVDFQNMMERVSRRSYQIDLLYQNSLISLVSASEWFLSQVLHTYYSTYPDASGVNDHSLKFSDLLEIGSIDEARKYLLDEKIESILRGSFTDWIEYLKSNLKLSMGYLDDFRDHVIEAFQRRNLLVHNGGKINGIYLKKVPVSKRPAMETGMPIVVSQEYLDECISIFEKCFVLIGLELWKKVELKSGDRAKVLMKLIYRHLLAGRWDIAESLSYFMMNDKNVEEQYCLIGKINYWQSLKWQGRFDQVVEDIKVADFSAKEDQFKLAQLALLDKYDEFFVYLPAVIRSEKLTSCDVQEWPLFRNIRKTDAYRSWLESVSAVSSCRDAAKDDTCNSENL
jgi:hypothetical protein